MCIQPSSIHEFEYEREDEVESATNLRKTTSLITH